MMSRKKLILGLVLLSVAVIGGAFYYYDFINSHDDPRIVPARKLIEEFERKKANGNNQELLSLLDRASAYYQEIPGYQDSYELGVFDNDRAAIFITSGLYKKMGTAERLDQLRQARIFCERAIARYQGWKLRYGQQDRQSLTSGVSTWMQGKEFIERRVNQLLDAQIEIDRRLSVVHTNYGIVLRHLGEVNGAVGSYKKAIELWAENQTAENNLRVLAGMKPQKSSIIRKLFPPQRLKKK